ncbi:hypothetical protein KHC17_26855 (plasmid) [Agrobacterium salinitolerans]|uniref:hypothetical protein n=1 Tax=Agrobacterium salinitolerans TaxID=1183413 RepID=UPI001C230650|nr:hypothetical protein [Agrobacterium salinitolerans]QXC52775.1 hypothetical protein KHC17_26855 [Agrobacterium salinitolerans]
MMDPAQHLPRVFQNNLHRLYERVVATSMTNLSVPQPWELENLDTLAAGLDRAEAQVNAHTRNEAAKAFILVLSALFERQLRQWAVHLFVQPRKPDVQRQPFSALLTDCMTEIDMRNGGDIQDVLTEGHKVANIVRHGDGDTSADLRQIAPRFWQSDLRAYVDINPGPSPDSALLIVTDDYLRDYTRAGLRFWGRADRLPGAVNDPPF